MKETRRAFRDVADQSFQFAQIGSQDLNTLSQRFVPFDQFFQSVIDVHGITLYVALRNVKSCIRRSFNGFRAAMYRRHDARGKTVSDVT